MPDYFLGRQPIFDAQLNVKAYELLYRGSEANSMSHVDDDAATSDVLLNSFLEMGLSKVVGEHQAFVNLTRRFIMDNSMLPPPSQQLVLEILENIEVDDDLVAAVQGLKNKGYIIALDDFVFHEHFRPLVELADIIKIDLRALGQAQVLDHLTALRPYTVKLLAEKVETPDEFEWCRQAGFDYFQGYFLSKPKVIKGQRMPANRMNTLRIMSQLQHPDVEVDDLEKIIAEDVTMSYRLLRYINSAAFSLRNKIESIRHAVVYLGMNEVKHWANMIALSLIDDKPSELMTVSLIRAKMCELFATRLDQGNAGTAFIIGMFSLLDAMMDAPMQELLESLPLADEITDALLRDSGPYSAILHNTVAYEFGDWDMIRCPELSESEISDIYLEAVDWANATMRSLQAA